MVEMQCENEIDSFEVKHILKEINKILESKNNTLNIYRIQAYNSIICEYYCIEFTDFDLRPIWFLRSNTERWNNIKVFLINKKVKSKKSHCIKCKKFRKFKNHKISYLFYKTLIISIICNKSYSKH